MALVDYQNKVIYWDEVNWQWLPYVRVNLQGRCHVVKDGTCISVNCQDNAVKSLKGLGFSMLPLKHLGIIEVSSGVFLYNGVLYQLNKAKSNILSLVSFITGKSKTWITKRLEGESILSKDIIRHLVSEAKQIEYQGKLYNSYHSLAKDLNISYTYIYKNLDKGMSIEDLVNNYSPKVTEVTDHLGNKFKSLKSMLSYYNITKSDYLKREIKGWSLKEILTTPIKKRENGKEFFDFKGKVFQSLTSMAREYGVSRPTLIKLLNEGKTPEEVTYKLSQKSVKDHLGNSYPTYTKMAKHYGVNVSTFFNRQYKGWSLEEALTGKRKKNIKSNK